MNNLLHDMATEIREVNAKNGWGLTFNPAQNRDEIPSYIALIHSEITEAWQAQTPREAVRELGDVVVRCLDLGELMQPGYWADCSPEFVFAPDWRELAWASDLMNLHGFASQALELYRKEQDYTAPLLNRLHVLIAHAWQMMERYQAGQHPEQVIYEIVQRNRTRGYRHGGRRT